MTALQAVEPDRLDFAAAVGRLRPRLQRYAVRRLGDRHEAEELVQETLLRALHQGLRTEDELAAWCHVVTSRLVLDRLRVSGRTVPVPEVPDAGRRQRDTADVVVARDEARTALDALDAIAPRQAALLWAREVEGAGYAELCTRFGMTEPAVRSVLTRARQALRREYTARGGTLPHAGLALLAPWAALRGASRLHRVVTRGGALAVGALGATVAGSLLLVPAQQAPAAGPVGIRSAPQAVVGAATAPGRRPAPAPAVASRRAPAAPPPAAEPGTRTALAPLAAACPTGRGPDRVGAGGSDCVRARTTYVWVRLPAGPVGVREVGVRTNDYDCTAFPDTPVASCRTGASR